MSNKKRKLLVLPEELYTRLEEYSKRYFTPTSRIIILALIEYLNNANKKLPTNSNEDTE